MLPFAALTHYAGFDWAQEHHDVCVVDPAGRRCAAFRLAESAEGWADFRKRCREFPALGVAVETSRGWVIERLLEAQVTVYAVPPQKTADFCGRHSTSGAKDDARAAFALADALRVDGTHWRALAPEDPLTMELRLLCRDEVTLIEQRSAFVNQLRAALHEYYPTALAAFDDWTVPSAWQFLSAFPTPQALAQGGKRKWEKFLHAHRLARPEPYARRLALFARATELCGGAAVTAAKCLLAASLVKLLQTLDAQLKTYRERIAALFRKHPDHFIFESLPHAGEKLAPRLLSELGEERGRHPAASSLQCYAGTAPVTERSGRKCWVHFRQGCNKHLRHAVHLWTSLWITERNWGQVYYHRHRELGCSHADALRRLGNRLLKILWKMWQARTAYDAEVHQRNQLKHGSWVLQLKTETQTVKAGV